MEQKEQYSFEELCNNLKISMSAFSKASNVDEGTIARIRKGYPARRSTVNRLVDTFAQIYGVKVSAENVTGINLQQASTISKNVPVQSQPIPTTIPTQKTPQNRTVEAKRGYVRRKDTGLPEGDVLAAEFTQSHGIKRTTFLGHMNRGLQGEKVEYSERDKPNRPNEKERYLTSDQQADAIAFWKRHDVSFGQCDNPDCSCHQ